MENNKLNLSKMKHENVVVHCDTEDKAIKLLTALKEDGYVWSGLGKDIEVSDDEYKVHPFKTCYRISDLYNKEITFGSYDFYMGDNFKIITFDDLLEAPKYLTTEQIDALLDIAEQLEQEEVETVSKEEIITQLSTKKYLVSVVGGEAPKYIHDSLESAEKEAKRLASKEIGKEVMILEYVKSYQAKVIIEEM